MKALGLILVMLTTSPQVFACDEKKANRINDQYVQLLLKIKDVAYIAPMKCKNLGCIRVGISSEWSLKDTASAFGTTFTLEGCTVEFVKADKTVLLNK